MPNGKTTNADLQRQISELKSIVVDMNKTVNSINVNISGINQRCADEGRRIDNVEKWEEKHDDSHRNMVLATIGAFVSALLALVGMLFSLLRPK